MPQLRRRGGNRLVRGIVTRLKSYEGFRFIGDRTSMKVYDCDDADQLSELEELVERNDLWSRNLVQTFAPDELSEAANRSFKPAH